MEIKIKSSSGFTRIFDILTYQREKYPTASALNSFRNGNWRAQSIQEIEKKVNALSCWFLAEGYNRGDKIIFVPTFGTPEWMVLDFACQQIGLITVPIHPTLTSADVELIITETEALLCLTADMGLFFKLKAIIDRNNFAVRVVHLDSTEPNYFVGFNYVKPDEEELKKVNEIKSTIRESDLLTILYTSGSSGIPKGVMLSHANVVHNIKAILTLLPLEPHHRVISFLPFSHIFERTTCYAYIAFGVSLYFSQNKESFGHDFKTVKPYFCTSVPRVLEKMYDFMQEQSLSRNWIKRKLITWAIETGKEIESDHRIKPIRAIRLFLARILVLRLWRKRLGGRINYMAVGAAALRPDIGRLFSAAGIRIIEGYGMTETSPFISINRFEPGMNRFGTVGIAIPGVEIKIDEPGENQEGEILVKGTNVMQGYFKNPEMTKAVMTADGWFRTGDVGKIIHQRFLKITDRKKDIFKTSSGKYIAPQPLQNHFTNSPFIQRCMIIGFQRPYVTALFVPLFEILEAWCKQEQIHWTSPQFMIHNIKVLAKFQQEVDKLNHELPAVERVRKFVLCSQDWSVESGEVTATLKPVRQLILDHYQKEIEKMYP